MQKEYFLRKLDRANSRAVVFNKFARPGIFWKILRLLFSLRGYGIYILWKFKFISREKRQIKLFWGKKITADIIDDDIIILYIFGALLYSSSEYRLTKYFIKNLRNDDTFYDLGANYGFYTYLAGEICKEVHSFEPISKPFIVMRDNIKESRFFLNNIAVSDGVGQVKIYTSVSSGISTINKEFSERRTDIGNNSYKKSIYVDSINLDEYINNHNIPTFIKMDVEGAEIFVICGGERLLRNNKITISLEVCRFDNGGDISKKAVEKLRSFGYKSYKITEDGEIELVDGDLSTAIEAAFDNFIFKN